MSSDLSNLNYNQGPSLSPPTSDSGIPTATGGKPATTTPTAKNVGNSATSKDTLSQSEGFQAGAAVSKPLTNDLGKTVYTNSGGDPAPPAGLKGQSAAVVTTADTTKGSSSEGNPYFAPNPIAILSATMYAFYATMEKAALGAAKAVNKGMLGAAAESKSIAASQIAAGQQQANASYAQMGAGIAQVFAGGFSLGLMGKGLHEGLTDGSDAIKSAQNEFDGVDKEFNDVRSSFAASRKNYESESTKLTEFENELKNPSAGTEKLSSKKTKELEAKIADQQKVVKDSRKDMDNAHKDLIKSQEKWQAAKNELFQAKNQQFQKLSEMGQWAQAVSTTVQGLGQAVSSGLQGNAQIAQAIAEAGVTVEQTELQNINKATDAASQAFQSALDTMNGMRQSLDKAVDSVSQANNMRG